MEDCGARCRGDFSGIGARHKEEHYVRLIMQPRNGRSRRDGGRSIVWSWWRCRSRWRDTWRDLLRARRRLEARANCAILYTDNALMKHCPLPDTGRSVSPAPCLFFFFSLSFPLRFFHFSFLFFFYFLFEIGNACKIDAQKMLDVARSCQRGEKMYSNKSETTSLFSRREGSSNDGQISGNVWCELHDWSFFFFYFFCSEAWLVVSVIFFILHHLCHFYIYLSV